MGQLYTVKEAAPRWLKEVQRVGAADLVAGGPKRPRLFTSLLGRTENGRDRRGLSSYFRAHSPVFTGSARRTPAQQLEDHRRMRGKQDLAIRRAEGVQPGVEPTVDGGVVKMPSDVLNTPLMQGLAVPSSAAGTIGHAALHHELGERSLIEGAHNLHAREVLPSAQAHRRAAPPEPRPHPDLDDPFSMSMEARRLHENEYARAQGAWLKDVSARNDRLLHAEEYINRTALPPGVRTSNALYAPRPVASHFGGAPNVAEAHSFATDPEARAAFVGRFRGDPDNYHIDKLMTRFGGTPNHPIPLGGRQHRALEKALYHYAPNEAPARLMRNTSGTYPGDGFAAHLSNHPGAELTGQYRPAVDYAGQAQHMLPLVGTVRRNS